MKCQNCKKEMEEGFIIARGGWYGMNAGAFWSKEKGLFNETERVFVLRGKEQKSSYICKNCKLVTFQY